MDKMAPAVLKRGGYLNGHNFLNFVYIVQEIDLAQLAKKV